MKKNGMDMMTSDMMPGLPYEVIMVTLAISALLVVYFLAAPSAWKYTQNSSSGFRLNLLSSAVIEKIARHRKFQFFLQLLPVVLLVCIIVTGLFGIQSNRNFAPVLTWTVWWSLLIFDIVLLGRSWCLVCPWYAMATWLQRFSFWRRTGEPFKLNLPWPKALKNVYLATGLFLILTWLELGYNVTSNPQATALLAIVMTGLVVASSLIFEKMSFCRYGCLVGRICGLYALVAPVEIRPKDRDICKTCHGRECRKGSENGYPCPTDIDLGVLNRNTYCLNCTECIKSCPHNNVACNVRPFGADLVTSFEPKRDESILAIVLLAMTCFHGLTMTPFWDSILTLLKESFSLSYLIAFSVGMFFFLAMFMLFYAFVGVLVAFFEDDKDHSPTIHFAYALIPLALFYHLAHNGAHFIKEAQALLIVGSDPFGWGWDLLGYATLSVKPLLSSQITWALQAGLVVAGFYLSLKVCRIIVLHRYPERRQWRLPTFVFTSALILFHCFNLWLLAQPMVMRTGL